MTRVLAVTGGCCSGKTTTIDALNELLGWDRLSIDAERAGGGDWPSLARRVRSLRTPSIIESVAVPKAYREALRCHDTTIMLITCADDERNRRLRARGETRPTGRNYSRSDTHFRIDATAALSDTDLQQLAAMARTPHARRPAVASHP